MPRKINVESVRRAWELRRAGKKQEEIAEELGIAPRSVQNYLDFRWLAARGLSDLADGRTLPDAPVDIPSTQHAGAASSTKRVQWNVSAGGLGNFRRPRLMLGGMIAFIAFVGFLSVVLLPKDSDAEDVYAGGGGSSAPAQTSVSSSLPSVRFDGWRPVEPSLVFVGDTIALDVYFTNTGDTHWDFYAAVTLRKPDGDLVNVRPLRRISLEPGRQGRAGWNHVMDQEGQWDVVYGVWSHWQEGKEPEGSVGHTGWINQHIVAHRQCPGSHGGPSARIDEYRPIRPLEVLAGDSLRLDMKFTNTGNQVRRFVAGASVLDADKNIIGDYDHPLGRNLEPGEGATASWEHPVQAPGNYLVQFGVWEALHEGLVTRAPCPFRRLIVAHEPDLPFIDGVALPVPRRSQESQWISLKGRNVAPESQVILRYEAGEYPVPRELTRYEGPTAIKVFESLTVPGTWTFQVVNPDEGNSNLFQVQVLP